LSVFMLNRVLIVAALLSAVNSLSAQFDITRLDMQEEEAVVFIGPSCVDRCFPGQAVIYIDIYQHIIDSAMHLIDDAYLELDDLQSRKVKNGVKIDKQQRQIDQYFRVVALAQDFIGLWTNHDEIYNKWLANSKILADSSCYHLVVGTDLYNYYEVSVDSIKAGDTLSYKEYIGYEDLHSYAFFSDTSQNLLSTTDKWVKIKDKLCLKTIDQQSSKAYMNSHYMLAYINLEFQHDRKRRRFWREYEVILTEPFIEILHSTTGTYILAPEFEEYHCALDVR